jgi:hypothetical protein
MNPRHIKSIARVVSVIMLLALLAGLTPGAVLPAYAAPGDLTRVSVDSSGAQANGSSYGGQLSGDGRYVAFASGAPNLVADDTNNVEDIFVKDRLTGATIRVSLATLTSAQANSDSGGTLAISGDGRYVAFESSATNLVSSDTNGQSDIFVRDLQTGITTLVSVNSSGAQADYYSDDVSISDDGRNVAFHSEATNLVSGDTNNEGDIFVHNLQTGATVRASVDSNGMQADKGSGSSSISANGRYVVFSSDSTNLVSGDTNGVKDIFVHDMQTGQTTRESVNSSGEQVYMLAEDPSISGDGRYVTFSSFSENLMSEDTLQFEHVYVHDRQTGTTTLVSRYSAGNPMQGRSDASMISADGRYVAFSHDDRGDSLPDRWIYIHDRISGQTQRATPVYPVRPFLSADGRFLAYDSTNALVPGDTNGQNDVFVKEMAYPPDISPTVVSVQPSCGGSFCPYPTGPIVSFRVAFSELVTGVTADDFSLTVTGGISGATVLSVSGSSSAYVVNVNTGTGDGTLRLDVLDNDSIQDIALNPLGGAGAGNGNFTSGEVYLVDKNIPAVVGVTRVDPNPTGSAIVNFAVTFSEDVSGVDAFDFILTGNVPGGSIAEVTGSGKSYNVKVNTGSGEGTLGLNVIDNDSIRDADNHPIGGDGTDNGTFTHGEEYTINRAPMVMSSLRLDPNPAAADTLNFAVTFSEAVSGVDVSDFTPAITGNISGAVVANVSGAGNTYTVTVNIGTGDGTVRLDILDNDSIVDAMSNPLGGAGLGNGNYAGGDAYLVEKNAPVVVSSLRTDSNPTTADSVHFTVTFSESVSGVDAGDFMLTTTGSLSGASITSLSGSGTAYTITIATGSGNGTLRLDLIDNDSILDSVNQPLGGLGAGNGNFTTGEVYTINKISPTILSAAYRSTGSSDGWVLESSENSNLGGSKNSNARNFILGDDAQDRQFRSVLHFPTYYLPDNAVVTQAILMIKKQNVVGTDPFTTHQNISVDIRNGLFGNFSLFKFGSLQPHDFQAAADMYMVGTIQNNPVSDWYWATLDSRAFPYINLTDVTQLRLGFQLDDNDDLGDDYIRFYSGDYDAQKDRPHLLIEYYVPR